MEKVLWQIRNMTNIGIYIIENKVSKSVYIGSTTIGFQKRFKQHIAKLKNNKHTSKPMQKDYNDFGIDMFTFSVLEEVENVKDCRILEKKWIKEYSPEYNMTHNVNVALVYDNALKRKMSISHGGKPFEVYKDGVLIGTYHLQNECANELNISQVDLQRVLSGHYGTCKGYNLKYVGEDFRYVKKTNYNPKPKKEKIDEKRSELFKKMHSNITNKINHARALFKGEVHVYKNDILISTYYSLFELNRDLGIKQGTVTDILAGRRLSSDGYTFKKETITKEQVRKI